MRRGALALLAAIAFSLSAAPLHAQSAFGRLEGTIADSVHARLPEGASVFAVRVDPPQHSSGATPDARGRYRVDSLPAGRYMVEVVSPFLDSLEYGIPPRQVTIEAGRATRADFAIPSGRTLRALACPGVVLPAGTGALIGRVADADTDAPLGGAHVAVAWRELVVDRATLASRYADRGGDVTTDSLGNYRLCGVPTDDWLTVQVQHGGRAGSDFRVIVADSAGVVVRHLSMSPTSSRPLTADAIPTDTAPPPLLTGTAAVSGAVRAMGGLPLAEAQVRVRGAAGTVVSDSLGRFSLGDLPAGTQVLEVRRIGYFVTQLPVELRSGRSIIQDVRLQRIVNLDSVRVVARRSRYREFENHRNNSHFGKFLSEEDVEKRHAFDASDLFRMMPGFRVDGVGIDAQVVSSRGAVSLRGGSCVVNIVIDGMPHQDINMIHPSGIGAIEVYRSGEPSPIQYENSCGLIVIWSKR